MSNIILTLKRPFGNWKNKLANKNPRKVKNLPGICFDYFLGAAHASLSVAKLWSASEVQKVSAWERALPSPLPQTL